MPHTFPAKIILQGGAPLAPLSRSSSALFHRIPAIELSTQILLTMPNNPVFAIWVSQEG